VYKNRKTYWIATGLPPSEHRAECKKTGAEATFLFELRRERIEKEKSEHALQMQETRRHLFEEKYCKDLFLLQPLDGWTKDDNDDDDDDVPLAVCTQQH